LAPSGIEFGSILTAVYQANVKGGTSTNDRRGRHVGRYDLKMSIDMEKLLDIEGGSFFVHGWGGWPDTEGIDGHSLGSAWGVNALAVGNRGMDIVEAFYEGPFFDDNLTITIGKLDFTGIFDASEYADDECCQFLNASLVDDSSIPFPAQGLGVVLNWSITDSWYLMGVIVDALGDNREIGFRTTFHDEDYFFYSVETGITAGNGTYRVGLWNDPQPKANSDGSKNKSDDRDNDVFSFAYVHGVFANTAASTYPEDYESVVDAYYNAQITLWFVFGPNIQYVANPGGSNTAKDILVFGLKAQMTF